MRVPDDCVVRDAMLHRPRTLPAAATVDDVRRVLTSPKVLVALLVGDDGRLLTVIERSEVPDHLRGTDPALGLGTLDGRTVGGDAPILRARARLDATGGRRLAVVADDGRLMGLLCLNRKRTGYCSDDDVGARARERAQLAREPVDDH